MLAVLASAGCSAPLPVQAANPGHDRPACGWTPVVLAADDITLGQRLPDWDRDRSDGVSTAQYSTDGLLRVGIGGPARWGLQWRTSLGNALYQKGAAERSDAAAGTVTARPT